MGEAIDTPSGDLKRDLAAQKRVMMWRPQPQVVAVRAMPDLGERVLRFVLATPGIKRDGHSVECSPEAWKLDHARQRCPMLWSHGYGDNGAPPLPQIGEWPNIDFEKVDGQWRMIGDAKFASWDLADILFRMYSPTDKGGDGMRGATSIGWTPLEATPNDVGGYHMTLNELNEASLVAMGADQNALQVLQRAINSGKLPEKYADHIAANRLIRAAEGKAYLLDFREPINVRTEPANEPEKDPETEPAAEPEVRMIAGGDDDVTFERVKGAVGFVLEHQGKPDQKAAQRQAKLCREAFAAKKVPELDQGWKVVPVVAGRAMVLARADGKTADRARVVRELTEALEKGTTGVLPSGWTLRSMTRSDRSDALDVLAAQLWAFVHGAVEPIRSIVWAADSIFYQDETGENYGGAVTTEKRIQREINVARSMLSAAMETLDAIEQTVEPAPDVTGTAMTASFQRVGKKYAAATVKKLKEMAEHHASAGAVIAAMLEEAEAAAKAENETASGHSEFARLAADLETASEPTRPEPTASQETPGERADPFADLTRSLETPKASTFADLTASLGAA